MPRKYQIIITLLMSLILTIQVMPVVLNHQSPRPRAADLFISQDSQFRIYSGGSIDSLRIVEYDNITDALSALESGEADIFGQLVNNSDYSIIDSYSNIEKIWAYDSLSYILAINNIRYPLNNHHLRRAIAYSINKTEIALDAFGGTVDEVDYALPRCNEFSLDLDGPGQFYDSDLVNATSELARAGMLDVDSDSVVEAPNGMELVLDIWYPQDIAGLNETAAAISSNLFDVGINNTLIPMNFTSLQQEIAFHNQSYDLALYQQDLPRYGYDWIASTFSSQNIDTPGENIANSNDPTLTQWASDYLDSSRLSNAINVGRNILNRIRDTCPIVPLFSYRWLSVYTDQNFDGWVDDLWGGAYGVWNPVSLNVKSGSTNELIVAVLPEYFENFLTALNPFHSTVELNFDWLVKNQFNPFLLIYDTPIATAPDGTAVPREATSWEMLLQGAEADLDAGQARARYYCDPNANWTDSQPLDAEDYRFTFEYYANYSLIENSEFLDNVKVTGNYIAGVTFDAPIIFAYRVSGALPILPSHIWEGKNATSWIPDVADVLGSGPFEVTSFTINESLVLNRNTEYYPQIDSEAPILRSLQMVPEEPIPAESVVFRVFVDDRSRISKVVLSYTYRVGQINFTGSQTMVEGPSGYEGTIPARITASTVDYQITATDIWGNSAVITSGSYSRETTAPNGGLDPLLTAAISLGISAFLIIMIIFLFKTRRS